MRWQRLKVTKQRLIDYCVYFEICCLLTVILKFVACETEFSPSETHFALKKAQNQLMHKKSLFVVNFSFLVKRVI